MQHSRVRNKCEFLEALNDEEPNQPLPRFDNEAEEAAQYYVGIFDNSKIVNISHYTEAGQDIHGRPPGSVMVVDFELDGEKFRALNGGPVFKFNEALSLEVDCENQEEIDYYWDKLSAGGDPSSQQCGWLKDKYGLSWQIVPAILSKLMTDADLAKSGRVMTAMLSMKKLDIAQLESAANGH